MLTICNIRVKPFLKVFIPHIIVVSILVFGIAFLVKTIKADEMVYSWKTKDGTIEFTDDKTMIPPAYKKKITIKAKESIKEYEKVTFLHPEPIKKEPNQICCIHLDDPIDPDLIDVKKLFSLCDNCAGVKFDQGITMFVFCF